ncbi:MAG: OmpA family protein [Pseudomonadota bacterium]
MSATILLGACTNPQIFDPSVDPNARAKESALAGALIGGVGGLIDGDGDPKNIIIGAAGGAAIGGVVGSVLDQQAADLRQSIQSDQIDVVNTGQELVVTMPQDILFAFDSDRLSSTLQRDLGAVASNLNAYPDSNVLVFGHTDNVGSASYNYDLSQRRANSVTGVLRTNGVSSGRLRAIGQGEDQPVASNLNDAGRAQNRRVEIVIRPYT